MRKNLKHVHHRCTYHESAWAEEAHLKVPAKSIDIGWVEDREVVGGHNVLRAVASGGVEVEGYIRGSLTGDGVGV